MDCEEECTATCPDDMSVAYKQLMILVLSACHINTDTKLKEHHCTEVIRIQLF